jgi:hypothetical protein
VPQHWRREPPPSPHLPRPGICAQFIPVYLQQPPSAFTYNPYGSPLVYRAAYYLPPQPQSMNPHDGAAAGGGSGRGGGGGAAAGAGACVCCVGAGACLAAACADDGWDLWCS